MPPIPLQELCVIIVGNLVDEQLELIKSNGGVVQTVAFSSYIYIEKHEAYTGAVSKIIQNFSSRKRI